MSKPSVTVCPRVVVIQVRTYLEISCVYRILMCHSGHLQTLYCVVGNFSKVDKVVYHRRATINLRLSSHYLTLIFAI